MSECLVKRRTHSKGGRTLSYVCWHALLKSKLSLVFFLFRELNRAKCSSSLKKLKKKSEGELSCSKENCPSLVTKMNFHKTNLKGIQVSELLTLRTLLGCNQYLQISLLCSDKCLNLYIGLDVDAGNTFAESVLFSLTLIYTQEVIISHLVNRVPLLFFPALPDAYWCVAFLELIEICPPYFGVPYQPVLLGISVFDLKV